MTYRTVAAHTIASALLFSPFYLSAAELQSPLAFSSFSELVEALLRSIVYIALPVISLFVVYAGFKFVMAQGMHTLLQMWGLGQNNQYQN
jgi:hypothetical protein